MNGAKSAYAVQKLYDLIFCVFRIVIVSLEFCIGVAIKILTIDNCVFFSRVHLGLCHSPV